MKKIYILLIAVLFVVGLAACGSEDTTKEKSESENTNVKQETTNEETTDNDKQQTEAAATEVKTEEPSVDWETQVTDIANGNGSETEKFDQVSLLAMDYSPTNEELETFGDDIVNEYKNGTYLSDITNHEYMLKNIFKAQVVDSAFEDNEQKPLDSFAFDFLQNSKYTYRGVDAVDSQSVQSNEKQMDDALAQIN
ncbi:hypothetical protein SFC66_06450 [Terribacillus saccharophilus]|uniref:hypothetical protein n=1 Tax=Terribacillus saccharophilus TaxID=361277 RepID=UPI003982BDB0